MILALKKLLLSNLFVEEILLLLYNPILIQYEYQWLTDLIKLGAHWVNLNVDLTKIGLIIHLKIF